MSPKLREVQDSASLGPVGHYILNYIGLSFFLIAFLLIIGELNESGIFSSTHTFTLNSSGTQILIIGIFFAIFCLCCLIWSNHRKLCTVVSEILSELRGNYSGSEKLLVVSLIGFNLVAIFTFFLVLYDLCFKEGSTITLYIFCGFWGFIDIILFSLYSSKKTNDSGDKFYLQNSKTEIFTACIMIITGVFFCCVLWYAYSHHIGENPYFWIPCLTIVMAVVFASDTLCQRLGTGQWRFLPGLVDVGSLTSVYIFIWFGYHLVYTDMPIVGWFLAIIGLAILYISNTLRQKL